MTDRPGGTPHTSRRSRRLVGIALTLPAFLLAGLLAIPGFAAAGELFGAPDLAVSISDSPDPVAPGPAGSVTFTVLISNTGSADSPDTRLQFDTEGASIDATQVTPGDKGTGCVIEGSSATCFLGYIPTSASGGSFSPLLAANEAQVTFEVTPPSTNGPFTSTATASSDGQTEETPGNNTDTETTTVEGGSNDSDAGPMPPGGELSTVQGTPGNPVSPADPFAVALTNVSNQTLVGFIEEEDCDGTQTGDALCNRPRLGGKAGDYQFSPSAGIRPLAPAAAPVVIAKAYYDRTLVQQADGVRIFYQKAFGGPVLRLKRCGDGLKTECFTAKKLASGDQIVRVPLKNDPRFTRG